jgi:hypothetical protein
MSVFRFRTAMVANLPARLIARTPRLAFEFDPSRIHNSRITRRRRSTGVLLPWPVDVATLRRQSRDELDKMISDTMKIWILTAVSAVTLALALLDVVMTSNVRDLQADVAQRQQYLNQSVQLGRLNTQIIQTLAKLSAQNNDDAIRSMLERNGVTFKVNAPHDDGKQGSAQ